MVIVVVVLGLQTPQKLDTEPSSAVTSSTSVSSCVSGTAAVAAVVMGIVFVTYGINCHIEYC